MRVDPSQHDLDTTESVEALVRRGAAWKGASEGLRQASHIVYGLIVARLITPEDFGVAQMALVIAAFVPILADLGMGAALVQRASLTEADRSTTFWLNAATGLALTAAGLALAAPLSRFFDEPQLEGLAMVTSLMFVVSALGATQRALLERVMDFRRLEVRIMIAATASYAVGIAVAASGGGPWAIVSQHLSLAAFTTALLWAGSPWRPGFTFSRRSVRELGGFSLGVFGNRFVWAVQSTASSLLIGRLLNARTLGIWSASVNLITVPLTRISIPLATVLFPAVSRMQDDQERIGRLWLRALTALALVTMPAFAGLAIVAPDLVPVLLGDQWEDTVPVIQILALAGLTQALQAWNAVVMQGRGRTGLPLKLALLSLVLVVAAIAFGTQYGVVGVAVCYVVVVASVDILYTGLVAREVGVTFRSFGRSLGGVVAATSVMVLALLATLGLLELGGVSSPLPRLLLFVLVGFVSYLAACRVFVPEMLAGLRPRAWRAPPVPDE